MKIVNLKQGSPEWHEWRKGGIGASDVPTLMLENPWESIADLWKRKTGRLEPRSENAAMRNGKDTEQAAREALGAFTGDFWAPICCEDDVFPELRASLDGWNGKIPAEIKVPSTEAKWLEMSVAVPRYYYGQLQHQIAITEAARAYFWAYFEGRGNLLIVERDDPYIVEMGRRVTQFWHCIELDTYPPESFFREGYRGVSTEGK